jgi:hypothetical protein
MSYAKNTKKILPTAPTTQRVETNLIEEARSPLHELVHIATKPFTVRAKVRLAHATSLTNAHRSPLKTATTETVELMRKLFR